MERLFVISDIREKMRQPISERPEGVTQMPSIRTEKHRVPRINLDGSHMSVQVSQLEYIFPPKGATKHSSMWHISIIVGVPNERNPGDISLIVELMQMLQKESFILQLQIHDSHASFIL